MARPWRLLIDGSASGPFNMGVDEALLETAVRDGRPSVRFYSWQGPWLSLGYGQRRDADREDERLPVGVVRRSTGGRAVLHGCDLTYSVTAPAHLLPDGLQATYALISTAIAAALSHLGVPVSRVAHSVEPGGPVDSIESPIAPSDSTFDCFAVSATDELCVGGRKLVGSAQRRATGGVLQHGSIRLTTDPPHVRAAVGFGDGVATSLAELHCLTPLEELRGACIQSLGEAPDASFERDGLTGRELLAARARGVDPTSGFRALEGREIGDAQAPNHGRKPARPREKRRPGGEAVPQ